MKKSEMYRFAQISVLRNEYLSHEERLDIIKILIDAEVLAKFGERAEEEGVQA